MLSGKAKIIILSATAIIAALLVGAVIWWENRGQETFAMLEQTLAQEVSNTLGTKVVVGQLKIDGFTTVVINGATVFSDDGKEMASVEKISASISFLPFLLGEEPVAMIRELVLKNPRLLLRQTPDNRWNIDDLKFKKTKDSSDFKGKIIIDKGGVEITTPLGKWQVENLSGRADCAKWPETKISFAFVHQEGQSEAKSQIEGIINTENNQMSLSAKVPHLCLQNYKQLMPDNIPLVISDGEIVDINVNFKKEDGKTEYKGQFKVEDAKGAVKTKDLIEGLAIADINIDKAKAWVTFNNDNIYILEALLSAASQKISAKGQIGLNGEDSALDLVIESQGVDLGAIFSKDIMPIEGPIAFRASLGGTLKNPIVEAKLKGDKVKYETLYLDNVQAGVSYRDNSLNIKEAIAEAFGGKITLSGGANLKNQEYLLHFSGQDLKLTDAASQAGFKEEISGLAQVVLAVKGSLKDLKSSELNGQVTIGAGEVAGLSFKNFYGKVEGKDNILYIRKAGMATEGAGYISAAGEIENGKLNLTLEGAQIQAGLLPLAEIKENKIMGTVSFDGKVTGDIAYPCADLFLKARNFQARGVNYGDLQGKLKITKDNIAIDEVIVKDNTGSHHLTGNIDLTADNPRIDITATTNNVRAETIAALFMPEHKVTGYLEQKMTITGSRGNFDAKGWIKLSEGSYDGYLIDEAKGDYEYKDKTLYVDTLTIRSLGSRISLIGTLSPDESLNFGIRANEISLARMPVAYPYPVTGWINIIGRIKGKLNDPIIEGEISASRIRANGQILSGLKGEFNYRQDIANISSLSVRHGIGQFYFYGTANVKTMELNGRLIVENASVPGLLELAKQPKFDIDGLLSGNISLAGTVDKPSVSLRGEIRDGRVRQYDLGAVEMNASFTNNIIRIINLKAEQDDGVLAAQGELDLNGDIDMEIGGENLNVGLFTALLDTTFNPPGKVTFTAQTSGSVKNPHVDVSLEIDSKGAEDAGFDHVYGMFAVDNGVININQFYAEKGLYKASAHGILPLKALNVSGRKQADNTDEMDIMLKLDNADLSILPLFFKEVKYASGPTTGQITVTGTLANPKVDGRINIADGEGTVKLNSFADPIEKIGVDIIFKNDTINIDKFSGQMRGGSYSLTGEAAIKGLGLSDYNLSLIVDKLKVRHKYFDGLLDAALFLSNKGQNGRPLLSGNISAENAVIDIPGVPEGQSSDLDVELDVEVSAGRKVRLYNPYLFDLLIDGKVKVGGTAGAPNLSGHIESRKGSIIYLTTRFNVTNALADFAPHQGLIPNIRLAAKARAGRTLIMLDVGGTADALRFKLESDPPMSRENIIKLLTFGIDSSVNSNNSDPNSRGNNQMANFLAVGLQIQAVSQVEGFLRNSIGIDEFRIEPVSMFEYRNRKALNNTDSEYYGYSLKVGKYLTDKIMLSYSTALDQTSNSITVQYDINRHVSLSGTFGGLNNGLYTVESRFKF